ncbi:Crp/Fnr family transcriptional regulator [Bosea rubneri]|uniref:Crp/Fnr family transcriptional regulator n=1 Tax=Bosea rubneri TaxID=3075434 RepID=A0ABU3SDM9_9HYPH|nr:Crp/Fnr family transcriptional regulator [Bosea sp. ZW T0_25]MDU0342884.1 Crp/Fnr family transcriptional regulator [Bosea sp. ZW T0_25]
MLENGWLSHQPRAFQTDVLARTALVNFSPGQVVYSCGDELGGIYGLVSGIVTINTAPPDKAPEPIHIGELGGWTGEDGFLTRQPRRIELCALIETWMMYLPLEQMDEMVSANPAAVYRFAQILLANADTLVKIIRDLQKLDPDRRIASALLRMTKSGEYPIPLTQSEIGSTACASRRQVNSTLRRFSQNGWIEASYRSIQILNAEKLRIFAAEEGQRSNVT